MAEKGQWDLFDYEATSSGRALNRRDLACRRLFSLLLATFVLATFGLRVFRLEQARTPEFTVDAIDKAQECAKWPISTDSNISTVSFDLLKGADLLFTLSRGPVTGQFELIRKTNYSYPGASPYITCRVGNDTRNERGVLIWGEPLAGRYLAMFSHYIGGGFDDWWSPTRFRDLRFKSSDASILFDSHFNAPVDAASKYVQTSNSPLRAQAWMNGQGAGSGITLNNSNGTIVGAFGVTTSRNVTTVKASIQTSHAAVRIDADPWQTMTTNWSLILDVSTSEAGVSVYLPPAYEGGYDVQTTEARALVDVDPDVSDPSGMKRQRTVRSTGKGPNAQGYMYWSSNGDPSEEGRHRGFVSIRSTKSDVAMYV
ncbi:hypothetical protein GGX14DRAFT_430861 [Mycena pura]|uniref:Uncharacterized protein n=1 Tax=Mycena pura TaxID=153505 RepID=A0AAD6VTS1_9AGAR|nr:hypothetical protein GGX14DRAFT_430861 [Mycena pura]